MTVISIEDADSTIEAGLRLRWSPARADRPGRNESAVCKVCGSLPLPLAGCQMVDTHFISRGYVSLCD